MKDSFLNFLSNTTLRPPYNVYKDLAIQNNIRNIQKTDEMDDWINKMRSQFTYMKIELFIVHIVLLMLTKMVKIDDRKLFVCFFYVNFGFF